jgi:hypothetical protein
MLTENLMKSDTVEQLLHVLANLVEGCHDLDLKAAAAERVFQQQAPALFEAYVKEIEHLRPTFDPSPGAMVLSALREKLLHG